MKILAIDSSGLVASVAVVEEDNLLAEYTVNYKKTHSQTLMMMLDEIVKMLELDLSTIDAIAVAGGPGSFTGLRIGSATAKGLGLSLGKPIISVPTVDGLAYNLAGASGLVCPIMDARRNQVYTGIFKCEEEILETILPTCAIPVSELVQKINELGNEVIFIGDGIPVFKDSLDDTLAVKHFYAKQHLGRQKAGSIGAVAWDKYKKGEIENANYFAPDYLRLSQAERERLERA